MTAQITELIDTPLVVELVRDKIAAILLEEQAAQQALASAATPTPKDPRLWTLRVFTERTNPWAEFQDSPDQLDAFPIVNISIDNADYDPAGSDVVERQKTIAIFNIDCYGYGVAGTDGSTGHIAGDEKASFEALRAFRLVRRILMAGHYTYLGLRGTVGKRWPRSFQLFKPTHENQPAAQVMAVRFVLEVWFAEVSPQVLGEILETISVEVKRGETGEVFFTETIDVPPPP